MTDQNQSTQGSIEYAVATTTVEADVEQCFSVGVDIESYPQWVDGLSRVEIENRDEKGRPKVVEFDAEALGRRSQYALLYDYTGAPGQLAWSLVRGDLTREIRGRYVFTDVTDGTEGSDGPVTEVNYELTIDLAVPLPGFVKRRAEDKIVRSALAAFKKRVESRIDGQ